MKRIARFIIVLFVLATPASVLAHTEGLNTYIDIAVDYLGLPGDCYEMATKYLRDLYNDQSFKIRLANYEEVSYDDAGPGDVIFYESCASSSGGYTTH